LGLFSNALKFTKRGGIKINVSIDSEVKSGVEDMHQTQIFEFLKIEVEDTGIGIKRKD
jgi:signal transduction histidine kinase